MVLTVRDPDGGGAAGDDWIIEMIQGTTLPPNSIALAQVTRSPGESGILGGAITDVAPRGAFTWTVSNSAPSGRGIPGDLWVVCT